MINDERSGWLSTSRTVENIQKITETVRTDHQLTVGGIADKVQIDRETARKILTEDLCMRIVCATMVPKRMTDEQKEKRLEICHNLLERQDDFLDRAITGSQYDT